MNSPFDFYNVFARTMSDATRQLIDINTRTYEKLAKRQVELASDFVESAVKQAVTHYVAAQRQLVEEYADKVQKANKDAVKIIAEAQDELNGYVEQQLPAAMEQVRSVVKDATQEAAASTRSAASKKAA
jgi:vacuolar-type H+-ATPase subunit H